MNVSSKKCAGIIGGTEVSICKIITAGRIPVKSDGTLDPAKVQAARSRITETARTKPRTDSSGPAGASTASPNTSMPMAISAARKTSLARPFPMMPWRGRACSAASWPQDCNPLQRALGWFIISMLPPLEFEILPKAEP